MLTKRKKKQEPDEDEAPADFSDIYRPKSTESQTIRDILMGPPVYDPNTGKGVAYDVEGGLLRPRRILVPTLTCPHCNRVFTAQAHLDHHLRIDHPKEWKRPLRK